MSDKKDLNERIDFNPKIWGPKKWFILETIVRSLPSELSLDLQNIVKNYFITTSQLLPCSICRTHMDQYIIKTNMINLDFSLKDNIIEWLNNFHNSKLEFKRTIVAVNNYYKKEYDKYNTSYLDLLYIIIIIIIVTISIKILNK